MTLRGATKNAKVRGVRTSSSSRADADEVRLDELLTETITGEWGGESSPSKGVVVLRTTNFTNCGEINYDNLAWREIAKDKVDRKHLCIGDIVVEKSGGTKDHPVGRVVFFDRTDGLYLCNNFTQILRPDRNLVDPRFLFFTLMAKYEMRVTESMFNKTTGIQNLKMSLYMAMPIALPSIPIQRHIADELDRLLALKKNTEGRLVLLDQIVKSRFVEMFGDPQTNPMGWPVGCVSDVSDYWNGLTYKPADVSNRGIIVLRSSNIQNGEIDLTDLVRVNVKAKEKNYVQTGDILMCSRNGSAALVGKTAIIPPLAEKMYFGAFMMIVRAECPEYLNAFFKTKAFRAQIACGKTATVNQITCTMMDKVRVPLPPLPLQRKFAKFVAEVEKLKANLRETAATLDQIYRAKQQEYFG